MKKIRSAACFLLIFILLCALPVSAHAADSKTVVASNPGVLIYIDEKLLRPIDATGAAVAPLIIDGTTYLPVRAISEALALIVEWDGEAGAVYLSKGGNANSQFSMYNPPADSFVDKEISIIPGAVKVYYNSALIDAESFLYHDTTYLPLRAISEALGFNVNWHAKAKSITISSASVFSRDFYAAANVPSLSKITGTDPCYMDTAGSGLLIYQYDVSELDGAANQYVVVYASLLEAYGFVFNPINGTYSHDIFNALVSFGVRTLQEDENFSVLEILIFPLR